MNLFLCVFFDWNTEVLFLDVDIWVFVLFVMVIPIVPPFLALESCRILPYNIRALLLLMIYEFLFGIASLKRREDNWLGLFRDVS